jgi:predicted transcriptional regulator
MFLRSMDILMKHRYSSLRSMKRREGVFSPKAQKRYVYKSFMHRKEVNCKIVYILYSKLYTSNITDLVQQMFH